MEEVNEQKTKQDSSRRTVRHVRRTGNDLRRRQFPGYRSCGNNCRDKGILAAFRKCGRTCTGI